MGTGWAILIFIANILGCIGFVYSINKLIFFRGFKLKVFAIFLTILISAISTGLLGSLILGVPYGYFISKLNDLWN